MARIDGRVGHPCPVCGSPNTVAVLQAQDRFYGRTDLYQLQRCRSCALVWVKDPPAPDAIGSHYGSLYHKAISTAAETSSRRWQWHRDVLLRHKTGGSLLDMGCSSGVFLSTLPDAFQKLYGVELDASQAAKAKAGTRASVFVCDILEAPLEPASLDCITAFDVLEHLYHPAAIVEQAWRWLKPGGIVYLAVPNIDSWEARLFQSYWFGLEVPRHLYHYSPGCLRRLFASQGFSELSVSTPRATYVEHSARYIVDDICRHMGAPRRPLAAAETPHWLWRGARKLNRMTILSLAARLAARCNAGPNLEAVFQKA